MSSASAAAAQPQPSYFGPSQELFGMYHPAEKLPARATAVVLCYPAGHEALRVQRAFRNLAAAVARLGFPVLRFDYRGTGDSAGDGANATLDDWRQDLRLAIDEVKRRSGARRVAFVGQRLGAALAWIETLERPDVDVLVLWDPVVNGRRYLSQLREVERTWLAEPSRRGSQQAEAAAGRLLGFPLGPALARQIETLEISATDLPGRARVFAILAADVPEEVTWRERLQATYGSNSCGVFPTVNWTDPASIHTAAYPQAAQQLIATILDKSAV